MKYYFAFIALVLLAACNTKTSPSLQLTVNAPGITNGLVIIKQYNEVVETQPIKNGQMSLNKSLPAPAYYTITVIDNNKPADQKATYDVYLEQAAYKVDLNTPRLTTYPEIKTSSSTQNQLSGYYKMLGNATAVLDKSIDSAKAVLATPKVATMPKKERAMLYTQTQKLQEERRKKELETLKAYVTKNPQNEIGAHIMVQQAYFESPAAYNAVFAKLPQNIRESDDGIKISNKLNAMLHTLGSSPAPALVGNTPDGKAFNRSMLKNKVTLIEFWKSSHQVSAINHAKMVNGLILTDADKPKFGILSVSLDTDADEWKKTIDQDHLSWLQISDLKGDASPNVTKWNITKLPAYFLVDYKWRIIKADADLIDVDGDVHEYLQKHR
ncbi:hypothetical protein FPZ43_09000 [Mucilaginibacter pallidiroseus]|uniref:DUF4369 domain-containing protein n=1 Tax=Mucilaginibacter pallidiroseus TaxID=2599295 RepID=A0A563UF28_9SPHI|nr:thioredoxin-like domain-containing protein [Mucilaginibacter pallidiroseus]TWR29975.1 hypothetical protein FPZ43_09000 [Mucilaginibacter pallidiroseus]